MHGLINKAIETYLGDTYGLLAWREIATKSGVAQLLDDAGFEAMQRYDDAVTDALLTTAASVLRLPRETLLEDLGTFLVSNERVGTVRRLLRFGGVTFTDFLFSLDDLPGRSHLAVSDLGLPDLWIDAVGCGQFRITCQACPPGFGHVLQGVIRALADDYGALVVIDHLGRSEGAGDEVLAVEVHDPFHADGNRFDLAAGVR